MGTLSNFAQYYYTTYTYEPTTADAAAVAAGAAIMMMIALLFSAAVYVVFAIFLSKIFKKAGVPAWIAWVPFYNQWKLLEIGGQQGYWAVLSIIPIVNIVSVVFTFIAMYHIGKKLGKSDAFVVLGIFLPIVWVIWLGVDKATWNDKASSAPSLHKPAATAA